MNKTLFALLSAVVVLAVLAGGTAFIMQQNKLAAFRRLAVQAEEKIASGKADEAVPDLRRIESRGGSARSSYLLGKIYYDRGDHSQGLEWFRRVMDQYPKSEYVSPAQLYEARHALEVEGDATKAITGFLQIIGRSPNSDSADYALLQLARMSYDKGDMARAKQNLEMILKKEKSPAKNEAEFLLGDINMAALYGPAPGPGDEVYVIKSGDRLANLSKKFGVPVELIMTINKVNPRSLTIGDQIKIPRLNLSVVVDKEERTLTLKNNNQLLKKYRVGINRNEKLVPAGDYVIQSKTEKPEYIDPTSGASVKAGAPENPLGARYMTLRRDMGIHGTNSPEIVGTYAGKGWISMKNEDVEELYGLVQAGRTPVTIRGRNQLEDSSTGNAR